MIIYPMQRSSKEPASTVKYTLVNRRQSWRLKVCPTRTNLKNQSLRQRSWINHRLLSGSRTYNLTVPLPQQLVLRGETKCWGAHGVKLADQESQNWLISEEVVESRVSSQTCVKQPQETKEITTQALQNLGQLYPGDCKRSFVLAEELAFFFTPKSIGSTGIWEGPSHLVHPPNLRGHV